MIVPRTWFAARATFALLTLVVVCGSCDARSRMWKAQVEQRGDLPCFTVEDDETGGSARARFISVSEIDSRGAEKQVAWMVSAPGTASLPLSSGKCLEYAAVIPDATINTPAQPLQLGRHYEVFINADLENGDNRRYRANFCLTGGGSRQVHVHTVEWDEQAGERRWDACHIPE